jgi:serine/threonine protein kinase
VETIGEGSFGTVFLIRDNSGRRMALKKIHVDPFQVDEALKEIEIMKKFEHPNLVKIYNDHFDEGSEELQIIMEYCSDGDLLQYFKKKNKSLTREEILDIFRQVVKAFIVLSVKGVIHRDLKPENLLMEKGVIKVADFGCARSIGELDMSKMGNFSLDKGTFIYASPEQLKNEKYSFKCDVWAAGCLLYFFTFGLHPFFSSKAHNTLASIRKMTEKKELEIPGNTDPSIAKLLTLTLIYDDK